MLYMETVYIYIYLWFIIQEPTKQIYEYFFKNLIPFKYSKQGMIVTYEECFTKILCQSGFDMRKGGNFLLSDF